MRYITHYDIIKERNDDVENLLLLHPSLIKEEIPKIEKHCPIYTVEKNKEILIINKPIEDDRYTGEMRYYIPGNVLIPIGGLEGKYYLESYGTYVSNNSGITLDLGYAVKERETGKLLFEGNDLTYLGKNIARLNSFIITKKNIFCHRDACNFYEDTGYVLLHYQKDNDKSNQTYFLYDAEGNIIATDYNSEWKELFKIGSQAPVIEIPELPKKTSLFEVMIINSLKDKKELEECDSDNLIEIADYLQSRSLDLAIDLDSLRVYKTNYSKYFRRQESKGRARTLNKDKYSF